MYVRKLILLTAVALLIVLTANCACGEVIPIAAGWQATTQGYFFDEQDGRDTLSALKEYRQKSELWAKGYDELRAEFLSSAAQQQADLKNIELELNRTLRAQRAKAFWNVAIPVSILSMLLLAK